MSLEKLYLDEKLKQILNIDSFDVRGSDDLDFTELSVTQIRDAIEYAYEEGFDTGKEIGIRQHIKQDYY